MRTEVLHILNTARVLDADPVVLDDEYLRTIQRLESLPQNQSRADKTWVWESMDAFEQHHRRAVMVR